MENKREYIYDFLRVISIIGIISIHCIARIMRPNQLYNTLWWQKNILEAIVRPSLIIFVLVSGALILNKPEEKISTFYYKRFIKIVIPFLIYSFIYVWINKYNLSTEIFIPKNILKAILSILKEPASYQLWFIYMIIGIYIFAPYLKKMLKNLNEKEIKNLFILLYIISIIKYFLPLFNIEIGIANLLIIEWIIPFVMGYLLTKEIINKHYKLIYILGFISFIFLILAQRYMQNTENLYELAPTMLMQSSAIFIFFIKNKQKICESKIVNKIMYFISKYTYDIFLVHVKVLDLSLEIYKKIFITDILTDAIMAIIVNFILSLIIAIIIHNIIKIIGKIIKITINKITHKKIEAKA